MRQVEKSTAVLRDSARSGDPQRHRRKTQEEGEREENTNRFVPCDCIKCSRIGIARANEGGNRRWMGGLKVGGDNRRDAQQPMRRTEASSTAAKAICVRGNRSNATTLTEKGKRGKERRKESAADRNARWTVVCTSTVKGAVKGKGHHTCDAPSRVYVRAQQRWWHT